MIIITILGVIYLLGFGYLLGRAIFAKTAFINLILGLLTLLCSYSILGALFFYIYQLNTAVLTFMLLIVSAVTVFLYLRRDKDYDKSRLFDAQFNISKLVYYLGYLALYIVLIFELVSNQTAKSINSPWVILGPTFILLYFVASLILILILRNKNSTFNYLLLTAHVFLTVTIAFFVYKIGYGFDPFIHQATEKIISQTGTVSPKPFYYVGQYSLVVFLNYLLQLPIDLIDKSITPIFLSLFGVFSFYYGLLKSEIIQRKNALLSALALLIIPYSIFISSTPQALANIFVIMIIFLALSDLDFKYLIFLALTAILIHPLAGLPILLFLIIFKLKNKILLAIVSIFSAIALPAVFLLNSLLTQNKVALTINFSWPQISSLYFKQYHLFLDLFYFYQTYIYLFIFIVAIITAIYLFRNKKLGQQSRYLIFFAVLIINYFITNNFLKFNSLINYEQADYANRLLNLSWYFLLLLFIIGLDYLLIKAKKLPQISFIILFLTGFLGASFYLSYPRQDFYQNSKLYSVSDQDIKTVQQIDSETKNNYLVLANQQVAAAAVKTLGFKDKYVITTDNQSIYTYPIPTGGPLYQYYLKMIEQPSRQTISQLFDWTKANTIYFVVNKYWSNFDKITEAAKSTTDYTSISADSIIFKYTK